ncbi:hypothetical protein [Scopulibacillus cellulosilyticus]|uniref:Uncharacterized protein n=1 Tax=Scopulibacillus cellulosilyticus TaxID=2665665 RepID=A0ABW2Q4I8_9BACL
MSHINNHDHDHDHDRRHNRQHVNFRTVLRFLAETDQVINEVSLINGQSLFGVTVERVFNNFVTFREMGSAGTGTVLVRIRDIVSLDFGTSTTFVPVS